MSQTNIPQDLSELPAIKHPFEDYNLQDAVRLAINTCSAFLKPIPATLEDVREVFALMASNAGHVWITGMVALDVLDAAIDGRDLAVDSRYR